MKFLSSLVLTLCLSPIVSNAAVIDFNSLGPIGVAPPSISAGGVSVSFSNLEISEIGHIGNGFGGPAGSNQVFAADQVNFNGRFLTALGFGRAQYRTSGFIRTIQFDKAVKNVSMYVADMDAGESITANAFDEFNTLLSSTLFPKTGNSLAQLVDFGSLTGIRKVTLVGNDPVGIDNLSFELDKIEVAIDIKPGSDPNCFNVNGHGVIPVAILGSSTFDVTLVDTGNLLFGGLEVRVRGNKGPLCSLEDSNGDLMLDLVCHFEDDAANWSPGDSDATLTGTLLDSTQFEGTDSICVVP